MGIISKLKSILGAGDGGSERAGDGGTSIAVGREPEAAGERAVKGGHARERLAGGPATGGEEPVESIKGIGPAYAQRLRAAGVHSVADLAAAHPDDLAEEAGIGTGRLRNWFERARARAETTGR